jgi:hypothetical protein
MRVTLVRNLAKMWNHLVAFGEEVSSYKYSRTVRRGWFHDNHGGPSPRPLAVIAEVSWPRQAFMTHVDGVSAEDDAILERGVAKLEGREKRRVSLCHDCSSRSTAKASGTVISIVNHGAYICYKRARAHGLVAILMTLSHHTLVYRVVNMVLYGVGNLPKEGPTLRDFGSTVADAGFEFVCSRLA